jgi:hypothetical protein
MIKNNPPEVPNIFTSIFLILLTLKLGQLGLVKDWSWWAIFSPLIIPILAYMLTFIIITIYTSLKIWLEENQN